MGPQSWRTFRGQTPLFLAAVLLVATAPTVDSEPLRPTVSLETEKGASLSTRVLRVAAPAVVWRGADGVVYPEIEGFGRLAQVGAPDLPARRERVAVDPGGELTITGVDVEWSEGAIPGVLASYPAQDPGRAPIAEGLQGQGEWWPVEAARVGLTDGAFRTLRFVEVELAPVQVNLKTGRFRVAERMTVRLQRKAGPVALSAGSAGAPDALVESLGAQIALGASEVGRAPMTPTVAAGGVAAAPELLAPSYPAWQFDVNKEGLYKITGAWAQTNLPGLMGRDPYQFRLTTQGVEVPLLLLGNGDHVFDVGDSFVFYGQPAVGDLFTPDVDPDATGDPGWQHGSFTDSNVYRLDLTANPLRIQADPGSRAPTNGYPVATSFRATARLEKDEVFWGLIPKNGVDHWYMNPAMGAGCAANCGDPLPSQYCNNACGSPRVCCGSSSEQTMDTPGHLGGSVTMRARMVSWATPTGLHRSEFWVNGVLRSTDDWSNWDEHQQEFVFTPSSPLGATTTVKMRLPLGRYNSSAANYVDSDGAAFNWVEADYDRSYAAVSDLLVFTGPNANQEIRLTGMSAAPEVWEISQTTASADGMSIAQPKRVQGVTSSGRFEYDVTAGAPATRRFMAVGPAGWSTPTAWREDLAPSTLDPSLGSSLKGTGLGADWVVIAHRSLVGGAQFNALVSRRQSQGLRTAVVDLRDVYDEFTDGIEDPEAIRDFIAWTLGHWSPAPTYVVLLGDATRDYKNVYGHTPSRQFVPSYMVDKATDPQFDYYDSDTWFAAVVGSDPLPDVLIGRIPAHSQAEAEGVFAKILSYEQVVVPTPAGWAGNAMLVSEYDPYYDFFPPHDRIYEAYFGPNRTVPGPQTGEKVYEPGDSSADATTERTAIKAQVNAGAAILSVVSHGGWQNWGKGYSFFDTATPPAPDDIDDLTNGSKLQFQIHANCISAHFAADNAVGAATDLQYTLLEDWIVRANKGAVAGLGPSHLSWSYRVESILTPAYAAIFGPAKERIVGKIDLQVRLNLDQVNDLMTIRSYVLMGDPATRLVVPAPPAPVITAIDTAGSGELVVHWNAVSGAAKYRVYRSDTPGRNYVNIGEPTGTFFLDTGLTNCSEYYYYVVSLDANGFESRWSNFNATCASSPRDSADCKAGTPENPDPPAEVLGVAVTDTQEGGRLSVSWNVANQASDVLSYRVFWGATSGGPYPNQTVVKAPTSSTVIAGLQNNVPTYVVVRAEHCTKAGPNSDQASGVPHLVRGISPPDGIDDLRVALDGAGPRPPNLKLTWTVPTTTVWGTPATVASVQVYASQTGPVFALDPAHNVKTLSTAPLNTWTHPNAATGNGGWWYTVVAVDPAGLRSAGGDELPDGVGDLAVHLVPGASQLTLTWSPLRNDMDGRPIVVTGYNLYGRASVLKRADCAPANRLQSGLPGPSTTLDVPAGRVYTWQLLAQDSRGGESVW